MTWIFPFEDGLNVLYGKMKPENPPFIPLSAECSLELNVSGDVLPKMIPIPALNHGPVQGLIRDGSVWKAREKSSGLNADFKKGIKALRSSMKQRAVRKRPQRLCGNACGAAFQKPPTATPSASDS